MLVPHTGKLKISNFFRPQQSCKGYVFTPVCHSVHRGGLPQCMLGHPPGSKHTPLGAGTPNGAGTPIPPWSSHPPPRSRPPRSRHLPKEQALPLGAGTPSPRCLHDTRKRHPPPSRHPSPGRRLLLRTVCILLECILVCTKMLGSNFLSSD